MCGIVGVAGNLGAKHEKMLKTLLVLDALRGTDSTGIATVSRQEQVVVAKQVGNPYELMEHHTFGRAMSGLNKVIIGHNRYATQGKVSKFTAHPFEFDTLVGVHNGTLNNKYLLDDSSNYTVDSENLYHHINKNGLRHAMNIATGAWSLVWWDKVESTLNFLRNKERPMFIAFDKSQEVMMWASERWMLEVSAARNEVELDEIESTDVDWLYTFEFNDKHIPTIAKFVEVKGREVPPPSPFQQQQGWKGWTPPATPPSGPKLTVISRTETKNDRAPSQSGRQTKSFAGLDSGAKNKLFEIVADGTDVNGSRFAICLSYEAPRTQYRLYLKKGDDADKLIHKNITANVGMYHRFPGQTDGFYKLEYSSFVVIEDKDEGKYLGACGNDLSKDDWEQAHGECVWCSGPIFAGDSHKFVTDGTLCGVCMVDEEVKQFTH